MDRYFILILLYAAVNLIRSTKGDVCNFDSRCQCSFSSFREIYYINCRLGNSTVLPQIHFNSSYSVSIGMSNAKMATTADAMFLYRVTLRYGKYIDLQLWSDRIYVINCYAFSGQEYTLYYLVLSNNNLVTVPECALKGMIGLRQLNLYGNKISSVNSHAFATSKNLTSLDLGRNRIDSIHCSAFVGLEYKLISLNLYGNNLSEVPECALKGLVGLSTLNLDGNKISIINSHAFVTLKSLSRLDLGENRIDLIHCSAFVGLEYKLTALHLNGNNLCEVPECALKRLIGLRTVYLNDNKISSINSHAFATLKNLSTLYLGRNRIDLIHCSAFVGLENKLAYLELSGNKLDEVPQCALTMLTKLDRLHLYDNNIHYVGSNAFANLTTLRYLRLDRNEIIGIDNHAFYGLNRMLYELNLQDNNISSVGQQVLGLFGFSNLTNVQYLYLRNNQLSEFTLDLKYFPKLRNLDVSNNRLRVLNIEGEFKDDVTLLASNNYLTAMPFLHFQVQWYYQRFSIDFSRNNITTLPEHQMYFERYDSYHRIYITLSLKLSDNSIEGIYPNFIEFNGSRDTEDFARVYLYISENAINNMSFLKNTNLLVQYRYVDLRNNKIMQVSENDFKLILVTFQNVELSRLFLGGNPLKCDCDLFWMRNDSYRLIQATGSPLPTCASPPNMKDYLATCFPASCDELNLHSPTTCARVTTTTTSISTTTSPMPSINVPQLTKNTPAIENPTTKSNPTTQTIENSTPKKISMEVSSQDSNSGITVLASLLCVCFIVLLLVTVFLCLLWRRSAVPLKLSSIKLIIFPGGNQHPSALDTQLNTINAESTANRVNENTRINAEATNVYQNEAAIANAASGQEITAEDSSQYIQLYTSTGMPSHLYEQVQTNQQLYENVG